MVTIGSQSIDSLFETDFDLEAETVEFDDLLGSKIQIGAHEDQSTGHWMIHPDKADQSTRRAPEQIQAAIR